MKLLLVLLALAVAVALSEACGSCGGRSRSGCSARRSPPACPARKKRRSCKPRAPKPVKGAPQDVRGKMSGGEDHCTSTAKCPRGYLVTDCRADGPTVLDNMVLGRTRCVATGPRVQAYAVCKKKFVKVCGADSAVCPSGYVMKSCQISLFGNLVSAARKVEDLAGNICKTIAPAARASTKIKCELDASAPTIQAAVNPETTADPAATTTTADPAATTTEATTTESPFKEYYDYLWALYNWYARQRQAPSSSSGSGSSSGSSCHGYGYGHGRNYYY